MGELRVLEKSTLKQMLSHWLEPASSWSRRVNKCRDEVSLITRKNICIGNSKQSKLVGRGLGFHQTFLVQTPFQDGGVPLMWTHTISLKDPFLFYPAGSFSVLRFSLCNMNVLYLFVFKIIMLKNQKGISTHLDLVEVGFTCIWCSAVTGRVESQEEKHLTYSSEVVYRRAPLASYCIKSKGG